MARLGEAFHAARERAGLSLLDVYVHGREHEQLYQLAEALMELDEWMQTWRIRHYRVVARVIGEHVIGTQGTPVEVLGRLIHQVEYPGALGRAQRADGEVPGRGVTLREEVTALLQELLRSNTVNPPGNETIAAELLRDYLERSGIPCELVGRSPERLNLVARLPGGDGPSLALLAHTDTVRADPEEWSRDPWSGDLVDGEIWGRGALDMKDQVAASAVAFASLWREGFRPAGDLILALTADEEVNDDFGLSWLVREHPELVRADYSLNEGGGERCVFGGNVVLPLRRRREDERAVPGARARPQRPRVGAGDRRQRARQGGADHRGARPLTRRRRRSFPRWSGSSRSCSARCRRSRSRSSGRARSTRSPPSSSSRCCRSRSSPTMIEASKQRNVIPATCVVTVDCRLPPGMTPEDVDPLVRAAIGPGDYELEWYRARRRHALADGDAALVGARGLGRRDRARARVSCRSSAPGSPTRHWMREAFGTVAYGFFPQKTMDGELAARLIHSADERIPVDDLELGVHALRAAATRGGCADGASRSGSRSCRTRSRRRRLLVPARRGNPLQSPRHEHRRRQLGRRPERRRGARGARRPADLDAAREALASAELGEFSALSLASRLELAAAVRRGLARRYEAGFSWWPPNCLRIADSTLFANSPSSRDENREYSAAVSTSAGTPSSIAAIAVQRPSPESETRPAKPSSVG